MCLSLTYQYSLLESQNMYVRPAWFSRTSRHGISIPFGRTYFGTWRCSGRIPLPYHPETADVVERTETPT